MTHIFNIGFNRSGSRSLSIALNLLNIPTIHSSDNKINLEKVVKRNLKNKNKLFAGIDLDYRGFSDFGGHNHYKLLYRQYPNSKFILTIRPFLSWFISHSNYIVEDNIPPELRQTDDVLKDRYIAVVRRYYDKSKEIRNFFKDKPGQFLELRICEGEGWEKLCPFLEIDPPKLDFPWENKSNY